MPRGIALRTDFTGQQREPTSAWGLTRRRVGQAAAAFYIFRVPFPRSIHLPAALLAALILSPQAMAGCAEAAAPGVDWRRCLADGREMAGVNLTGAILRDASLSRGRLVGAVLRDIDGIDARFVSADLSGVDFTDARLRSADFTRANLTGAILVRADLRRTGFFRANLTGADLTGAVITGADLSNATLDGALWTDGLRRCAANSVGECR